MSTKHSVKVTRAGSRKGTSSRGTGWRAVCSCKWSGKPRPARMEAGQDAGAHRLEVTYGPESAR